MFQSNISKSTVVGNCMIKNVDSDVKPKPSDRRKNIPMNEKKRSLKIYYLLLYSNL